MSYFKSVSPESQGIDSRRILTFLEKVDQKGLELHRLMILRHGKCIAKGSYAPYEEKDLHPLFSFTKSFTAAAIGFAIKEGRLSLSDPIAAFFPEELPSKEELITIYKEMPKSDFPTENSATSFEGLLENMNTATIHHLLTMTCGHEIECPDRSGSWIHSFFRQPFLHKPGTFYKYNTMGSNLLSAILRKVTGEDLTDYLRPRLFDPLGIGSVGSYHYDDSMETESGGSGFLMTLNDMARFTYFMLHKGIWEGKEILPGWYDLAAVKQIETAGDSEGHIKDWACGYGYQCWMGTHPGSFRADGAFGQFGLVFPDLDLCIIMNAATEQTQTLLDLVNDSLLPYIDEKISYSEEEMLHNQHRLLSTLEQLHLPAMKGCRNPKMEKLLEGKVFCKNKNVKGRFSGLKSLIGGGGLKPFPDDVDTISMEFSFDETSVLWHVKQDSSKKIFESDIRASLENEFYIGYDEGTGFTYAATAKWRAHEALELEIRRKDSMSGVRLIFRFEETKEGIICNTEADETLITDGNFGLVAKEVCALESTNYK